MADPTSAAFDRIGSEALAIGAAPGIAFAVVRKGLIVAERGFGLADLEMKTPVSAKSRFAIGSLTKQFTATAVLLLARAGKLNLDDSLSTFALALPNARAITLRMLLNQTSGLHDYPLLNEGAWPLSGAIGTPQIIAMLAKDRSDFVPGSRWHYSNANYAALAAVIERAGGMSYGAFLQNEIFVPLGMNASGFGFAAQQRDAVAVAYTDGRPALHIMSLDLYSGAGGIISSAHDLAVWDRALLAGVAQAPVRAALDREIATAMWQPGTLADGRSVAYGMGWIPTEYGGHREMWHNGLAPGVGGYCYNAVFPDDHLAVVVLTNGFGAAGVPEQIVSEIAALYDLAPALQATPAQRGMSDEPEVDRRSRALWDGLAAGSVDRSTLTAEFAALLTPAFTRQIEQQIALLGALHSFARVEKTTSAEAVRYTYALQFSGGDEHLWAVTFGLDGSIAGSRLLR